MLTACSGLGEVAGQRSTTYSNMDRLPSIRDKQAKNVVDNYPHGDDYAWVAVDLADNVAVFTNGGVGPIPMSVLTDRKLSDSAEWEVRGLPEYCRSDPSVMLPCTECYVAFACRGLFAYD